MNKINASVITRVGSGPQDLTPRSLPEMAPPECTPLTPPGQHPTTTMTPGEQREVPEHRQALFGRAFEQLQRKLADRRPPDAAVNAGSHGALSASEQRECDAALQWIAVQLSAAGGR